MESARLASRFRWEVCFRIQDALTCRDWVSWRDRARRRSRAASRQLPPSTGAWCLWLPVARRPCWPTAWSGVAASSLSRLYLRDTFEGHSPQSHTACNQHRRCRSIAQLDQHSRFLRSANFPRDALRVTRETLVMGASLLIDAKMANADSSSVIEKQAESEF